MSTPNYNTFEFVELIANSKDPERALNIALEAIAFVKENGADEEKAKQWLKAKYGVELISEREEAEA